MDNLEVFLRQLPEPAARELAAVSPVLWNRAEELRLRMGYPALFVSAGKEYTLSGQTLGKIEKNMLNNMINRFLNYSDYAHLQELRSGFVTLVGGHRVGFCGQVVIEGEEIGTIRNITSVNIRFARDIPEAGRRLWPQLLDYRGRFGHTLIASPPGCGKTTLLRSLIRLLSDGGYNVSVCDERNEIAGAGPDGFAFELGKRTDVMTGCSKERGMILLLRSMGPQILCTDEIGTEEEIRILQRGISSGVTLLTTIHAADLSELLDGPLKDMVAKRMFFRIVFLTDRPQRGTVAAIWKREETEASPWK